MLDHRPIDDWQSPMSIENTSPNRLTFPSTIDHFKVYVETADVARHMDGYVACHEILRCQIGWPGMTCRCFHVMTCGCWHHHPLPSINHQSILLDDQNTFPNRPKPNHRCVGHQWILFLDSKYFFKFNRHPTIDPFSIDEFCWWLKILHRILPTPTVGHRRSSMDAWKFHQILLTMTIDHQQVSLVNFDTLENLAKFCWSRTIRHRRSETYFGQTQLFSKIDDSTINHRWVQLEKYKPSVNLFDLTIDRWWNLSMTFNT